MKPEIDELVDLLQQEHALYARLLKRLEQEKAFMLSSQVGRLTRATAEKQVLSAQLAKLEAKRRALIDRIGRKLQIPADSLSLRQIARQANASDAAAILDIREALQRLIPKVRQANDESRCLVRHCLGLVQGSMTFIRQLISPSPVYGSSGGIAAGTQNGRLLSGQI
jgi:flagellar biosynthesis/type III secretory pathway chaperone